MDEQNRNLILATALSMLVILVWFVLFPPEEPAPAPATDAAVTEQAAPGAATVPTEVGSAPIANVPTTAGGTADTPTDATPTEQVEAPRLAVETPTLSGSISLIGGRIDDLSLLKYREELDPDSPTVTLLSPVGSDAAYYALYGWAPGGGLGVEDVPGTETPWTVEAGETLTPDTPVTLRWDSPAGLIFRRTLEIDEDYLIRVTQAVENPTETAVRLAPYGAIARHGLPDLTNFFILHEGVVAMANGELFEEDYDTVADFDVDPRLGTQGEVRPDVVGGWIGFTDKYWMTTLISRPGDTAEQSTLYQSGVDIYQTRTVYPTRTLEPGGSSVQTSMLFAGAKEWEVIRSYEAGRPIKGFGQSFAYGIGLLDLGEEPIEGFLDSIDWGWFFFLTKPIFFVLHELNVAIGNMGWSIILLTLLIKAVLFPLAYKSYVSMAKMKELQPEMEKIKERAGEDRQKLQQEMMDLYKKEKVNPASGCLPILLQIPIFFSLYKVIFVTLELRHAPWLGPFQDLSEPDPTSILNLFGLLPFAGPEPGSIMALIFIGILPLILGISMWLQQKLNPAPTDPTQQMIFAWMPWVFMFMLGGFASGLIVYWIANNLITFAQQYLIMRSQGYKPDVFGNILSSFKKSPDSGGDSK